jgi:vacuolar protein-sorting-associated protein 4
MSVDLSRYQRSAMDRAVMRARELEQQGRPAEAAAAWEQAATVADSLAATAASARERERRLQAAAELRQRATQIRSDGQQVPGMESDSEDEFREAAQRLVHRSSVSFEQIAGLGDTIREIRSTFALLNAQAPVGVILPRVRNVMFYGPPGCGKTLLAAAVSNGLDATFFSVKVSDLMSRYYGDSPRLVQALFAEARSRGCSVIFLDEFDALAASRSAGDSSADRRLLVSLLTELDGLNEKNSPSHVVTIAATNRPWDLDEAILSRFGKTILIPLPDVAARRELLQFGLQQRGYPVEIAEDSLLQATDGMSGREISSLCDVMIERMVRDTNPELQQGRNGCQLQVRPVTQDDLQTALRQIRPGTSAAAMELFRHWGGNGRH